MRRRNKPTAKENENRLSFVSVVFFCVLQLNDTHYECKQIYIYIKNNIFIVKRKKALFAPINRMVSFDFLSLGVFV